MAPAALIFDVDGTLAETEEAHRLAFNAAFAAHGLDWAWDVALYRLLLRVAGGKERIRHFLESVRPELLAAFPAERIAVLHADKTERYVAMVAAGAVPLRPGVQRLLAEAKAAGWKLGIATTTSRANILTLLRSTLGADGPAWFDVIATGEDASPKKPHPAVYLYALQRLGLPAKACLAIEDSVIGLTAATAAGIPAVVTRSAYCLDEHYPGARAVVADLAEVDLAQLARWHAAAAAEA